MDFKLTSNQLFINLSESERNSSGSLFLCWISFLRTLQNSLSRINHDLFLLCTSLLHPFSSLSFLEQLLLLDEFCKLVNFFILLLLVGFLLRNSFFLGSTLRFLASFTLQTLVFPCRCTGCFLFWAEKILQGEHGFFLHFLVLVSLHCTSHHICVATCLLSSQIFGICTWRGALLDTLKHFLSALSHLLDVLVI